jgi:hypothetical protein
MYPMPSTSDEIHVPETTAQSSASEDRTKLERIVRRAREIHREHGGWFGYDFEDWVQAWSE